MKEYRRSRYTKIEPGLREKRKFIQVISCPGQVGKTTLITQLLKNRHSTDTYISADSVKDSGMINLRERERGQYMINKLKFNASGMMIRVHILVTFLILLAGMNQTFAQNPRVYVFSVSNNQNDLEALAVESVLKVQFHKQFREQYPCAESMDDEVLRAWLDFEKNRQMLGNGDESALAEIGGSLGARYIISVNVIQNNGSFTLNAIGMDTKRGKTIARESSYVQGHRKALQEAESLAEKLVSAMINSMPDCYQNEWIGTITYRRERNGESRTTEKHLVFNDVKKTTEITSTSVVDAEFEVRGTKRPARVFVKCNEESMTTITLGGTVNCGGPTPFEPGKSVSYNSTSVEKTTGNAEGKSDEAVASVSVDGNEFTISITVPEIEGGTAVRDWTLKESGGCGDPVDKHESTTFSFTTGEEYGQVNGTIDQSKSDVLTGSKTVKIPSEYGIQEIKIITWNLRFISKPSLEKIK